MFLVFESYEIAGMEIAGMDARNQFVTHPAETSGLLLFNVGFMTAAHLILTIRSIVQMSSVFKVHTIQHLLLSSLPA